MDKCPFFYKLFKHSATVAKFLLIIQEYILQNLFIELVEKLFSLKIFFYLNIIHICMCMCDIIIEFKNKN